ncbi:MAG TPA: PEGA domain-containing protein [Patescibacteria group bacterium]|nr:PEGA domain-containing protein [Patescibacteria group bacterium]
MKRFLLFILPIVLGLVVFGIFLFFFTRSQNGNGALQVTAVPVSQVYLNGKPIGKTPLCLCEGKQLIPSGVYTIKLVPLAGDNLQTYQDSVTITKGTLSVVDRTFGADEFSSGSIITLIPLSDTKSAQLFVSSFPSGASVALDGNTAGTTPLLIKTITVSDHDITLSKTGYSDKTVHIRTVAGYELKALITVGLAQQNATQDANLQNASLTPPQKTQITILDTPTGFLRVRSEPSLSASETAQVKPGQQFDYVDEQDGWYEIALPGGSNGWISTQYAQKK